MAIQKRIIIKGHKRAECISDAPIPKIRDGYVAVKVAAVALNPTDWVHIDYVAPSGAGLGCDYAGTVEATGTGYSKHWKKGDRIAGFIHGANPLQLEDGAFAEHIVAKADAQYRIPDSMSFEEACTLGVGTVTVGQGLFQLMGLDLPTSPSPHNTPILIYGGSTATGTVGIQFAKLAGYNPIAICSPHNFDLVKSLGAAEVFSQHDADCAEKIRNYTDNKLKYAWDTISLESSAKICCDALSSGPDTHYGCLIHVKPPRDDVKYTFNLAYTSLGEKVDKFGKNPSTEELKADFEFAKKWATIVDTLLADGKIKVHPPNVLDGGLEQVLDGLDLLRNKKVSGQKLVYMIN